jgi:hypothetical protein
MGVIDFLSKLVFAPALLVGSFVLAIAALTLVGIGFLIALLTAMIHARGVGSWRESDLDTYQRVRISWSWGWAVAAALIVSWLASLTFRGHIAGLVVAIPYFAAALFTLGLSIYFRHRVRADLRRYQRLIETGR